MDDSLNFLVIDDHTMVRKGLALSLQSLGDQISISEAGTCEETFSYLTGQVNYDLIVLAIGLPDMDGIQCLKKIKELKPLSPVVISSASDTVYDIQQSLEHGASGFIHKSEGQGILLNAIRLILSGGSYFPTSLLSSSTTPFEKQITDITQLSLTPRQHQVLKHITQGQPNKIIADFLGCTESTIRVHATAIFKALGVNNRTEAAIIGKKLGLTETK